MAEKPKKHDIRMTVTREFKHDFTGKHETFTAYVVYMVEPDPRPYNEHDAGVRNPDLAGFDQDLRPLGSLGITAYRRPDDESPTWYGQELEYHSPFRVNARQLEFMVKFMRKVNAKLAKLEATWGQPEDLAAFCARAIVAVGGTPNFGIYHKDVQMNGTHYRWVDVDGLRWWLEKPTD